MTQQPSIKPDPSLDAAALWRAGTQALRANDPAGAAAAFQAIVDAGRGDATVWLGLSMARRDLGDGAGEKAALDQALEIEPRNIRALMGKADHYARANDPIAASAYYSAVVRLAETLHGLPNDLRAEANRAEKAVAEHTAAYESYLETHLRDQGLGGPGTRRVAASLDLAFGRKQIFQQQPLQYYFPELPQVQFYDREATPWLGKVDLAADAIRDELLGVLGDEHLFRPYTERMPDRPFFDRDNMLGDPNWSALFLWRYGEPVAQIVERCPNTMAALEQVPLCRIPGRTPSILFSLLRPGARIPPHTGLLNTRLICHLPLIVPEGCGFRVGNETRPWVEGRSFAFDDSIEHEAWNTSDKPRVVLIFDVWRPELTDIERELVSAMLLASDAFSGKTTDFET